MPPPTKRSRRLRADLLLLGLTGLHPEEGATTGNFEEAAIKRAIAGRAAEVVSLVTAEKIGAVSQHSICGARTLTAVVVTRIEPVLEGMGLKQIPA